MQFASAKCALIGVSLLAVLAGCATPGARDAVPGKASKVKAEQPVAPEIRRPYDRALAALQAGNHKEAETVLLELTRKYPDLSGPFANLGIVYQRTGRSAEAVAMFKKAIAINPEQPAYYNQLGIVHRGAGRFAEAQRAYTNALEVDANYPLAHLNLAILYDLYLGEPGKAMTHYRRYGELYPADRQQVEKWIVDLQQRTRKTGQAQAQEAG